MLLPMHQGLATTYLSGLSHASFDVSRHMIDEIAQTINSRPVGCQDMEKLITNEMAEVVHGSNQLTPRSRSRRDIAFVFAGFFWRGRIGDCGSVCLSVRMRDFL